MRREYMVGLAALVTAVSVPTALGQPPVWTPDKYGAPLHGEINISGATLFENYFSVPASTNDYIDADNNGDAGSTNGVIQNLAVPWPVGSTFWLVNYRGVGSVNGLGEFLDYQACGNVATAAPSTGWLNLYHYCVGGLGTTPWPQSSIDLAVLDVPIAWATIKGSPLNARWDRCPQDDGYGQGLGRTTYDFFGVWDWGLEELSRNCPPLVEFNTNNDPPTTPNPDANTLFDTQVAWVAVAMIGNRGVGYDTLSVSQIHHLWLTGRLPNGENLVAATRNDGSGTHNAIMNSCGIDPAWGHGDNVGPETANSTRFQLGPETQQTQAEGSGEMETVVQNWRLSVGYTGLTGSSRAAADSKASRYEILDVVFDDRGGTTPVRIGLNSVLDNCDPDTGWQIGGPETFVSRGDPGQTNPADPTYMDSQAAADYLNNITESIANFAEVPEDPANYGMPGEYAATKYFLLAGVDCLPDPSCPRYMIGQTTPPFNQGLQEYIRATNDLGAGGDVDPYGFWSRAGKVPIRNLNNDLDRNGTPDTYTYTDGSGSTAVPPNTNYCYCGGWTIAGNQKLGSRNEISGDFLWDGVRDLDDVEGMVAAYFDPRGWSIPVDAEHPALAGYPIGACIAGPAGDKENQTGGNYPITEVLGDFNGDGDFTKEDLRYFMDGLGIDADGKVNRKLAAIAIDQAIMTYCPAPGNPAWYPWADTRARIITSPAVQCDDPIFTLPSPAVDDAGTPFLATGAAYADGDFRGDVAGGVPWKGAQPVGWDGRVDHQDINYVRDNFGDFSDIDQAIAIDLSCDMDGNLAVDMCDVIELVTVILKTSFGDVNLDGVVDGADEAIINANLGQPGGWEDGDMNGDGVVDAADHNIWQNQSLGGITKWSSVRTHGGSVDLPIELDAVATGDDVVCEPRQGGVQKVEVELPYALTDASLTGVIEAENLTAGGSIAASSQALANGGITLVIEFAGGLPSGACFRIDLSGRVGCLSGDLDCNVKVLTGNTNGDNATNAIDKSQVSAMSGTPLSAANARIDVNTDGSINAIDKSLVSSLSGTHAACP